MQKVIGLDIGSFSIKAVEIVNTFKSYEISNFYENVIPHIENVPVDAVIPHCMEQLFKENELDADRIVTAMPGQFISSRILSFNFTDTRKIETAVFSEVEDAVPFNLDDMILDHQIIGGANGQSVALAVMTRKAFLRNFLELLQRINIDPKLVDVDSLAFYNLSSYMNVAPEECFAMVDVGHEKTSICIIKNGVLRMFRSINLGGRYITDFLARDLETTFQEAQRIKHSISRVWCADDQGSDVSGDEKMLIERSTLAANSIIKELGRTLYAFKTWEKEPLSRIFLSGGTANTKNFDKLIQDQLEVPTVLCQLDQTELKINPDLHKYMTIMPQSVAIGMRTVSSIKKHSQVNLRRGEFAYVQNYEALVKGSMKALRISSVVLALLVVSYGIKYYIYQKHIKTLQEQYKKEYLSLFANDPEIRKKYAKPMEFRKFRKEVEDHLQHEIKQMKDGIDTFVRENSGSAALLLLKEISSKLPKDVKVDVTQYDLKTAESGEIQLVFRAETDGYGSQEKIIDALKKVSLLDGVTEKQSGTKPGTNGKTIEFTISANYVHHGKL